VNSPETYFGTNRNEYLGNGSQGAQGTQTMTIPPADQIQLNTLYLGGSWNFQPEYAQNQEAGDQITYEYDAKNMYIVAASGTGQPITLKVTLDGQPVPADMRGADVNANSEMTINGDRLYDIIQGQAYGEHILQITIENPGLQGYTFTFG
jgi:hypothetical protein